MPLELSVPDINQLFADAVSKHQSGELAVAQKFYRAVLAESPNHTGSLCNLGTILAKENKIEEALHCYKSAIVANPGYADAHYNLGNLFRRQNKLREAAGQYISCLKSEPKHISAGFNLGLALLGIGDYKGAKHCLTQVVHLKPDFADAWGRLGDLYLRMGDPNPAIAAFKKYCELEPEDHRGQNNLALAYANAGMHQQGTEILSKLVKAKPDYAEAHNTLGVTLEAIGRKDDALFHYDAAVKVNPDFADAWSNRGINLLESGRADEAVESLMASVRLRPEVPAVYSNLLLAMNYSSQFSPDLVTAEHKRWGEIFIGKAPAIPKPADMNPNRVLKVGYVSSDFRQHTVAGFIEALLKNHSREKVHVTSYANVIRADETTEKLSRLSDDWQIITNISDEQFAHKVSEDKIDILVDLGGHTAGHRLLAFGKRPAPLQMTMFGYPNTSGIPSMDYRVTDNISDPEGETDSLSTEKLLRLPNLAWVYNPPANVPDVAPLPALKNKGLTFGCLNNAAKISDDCLNAWARIFQMTPGSRLVLMAGQSNAGAKRLSDRFIKAGILRDRVELVFRLPKEQYYQTYNSIDIALDPFPYNGGVTTCDALWMGCPVLTVEGSSYVSRQGLAVLATLGLPGFIARSPGELADISKSWNNRREELAEIRAGLRQQMLKSAVCDMKGYVAGLENAYQAAFIQRIEELKAN